MRIDMYLSKSTLRGWWGPRHFSSSPLISCPIIPLYSVPPSPITVTQKFSPLDHVPTRQCVLPTLKASIMPSSSSDQERAEQAQATCLPSSFTTDEIMAFQVVAQRLKINLSDMIRLAEIRQQSPNAPFPSLNDHVAQSALLMRSPYPTTEPTVESASNNIATKSTRHTAEEQGDGGYEAIQPDIFNSAAAGFAGELH